MSGGHWGVGVSAPAPQLHSACCSYMSLCITKWQPVVSLVTSLLPVQLSAKFSHSRRFWPTTERNEASLWTENWSMKTPTWPPARCESCCVSNNIKYLIWRVYVRCECVIVCFTFGGTLICLFMKLFLYCFGTFAPPYLTDFFFVFVSPHRRINSHWSLIADWCVFDRLRDGANKEILGIIVSYKVKVKLVVSRGGSVQFNCTF